MRLGHCMGLGLTPRNFPPASQDMLSRVQSGGTWKHIIRVPRGSTMMHPATAGSGGAGLPRAVAEVEVEGEVPCSEYGTAAAATADADAVQEGAPRQQQQQQQSWGQQQQQQQMGGARPPSGYRSSSEVTTATANANNTMAAAGISTVQSFPSQQMDDNTHLSGTVQSFPLLVGGHSRSSAEMVQSFPSQLGGHHRAAAPSSGRTVEDEGTVQPSFLSGSNKGKHGEGHLCSYVALVPQAAAGVSYVGDPRRGDT